MKRSKSISIYQRRKGDTDAQDEERFKTWCLKAVKKGWEIYSFDERLFDLPLAVQKRLISAFIAKQRKLRKDRK